MFVLPTDMLRGGLHLRIGAVAVPRPFHQPSQAQIVDNVLHSLDVVLDRIRPLAKDVILQIEELEPGKKILDEGTDGEGKGEVAQRDRVCGQAREILGEVGERQEILLDGEVESVCGLEIGGDCFR